MPPVGFEPTISAGERPQTYALDRAAAGTGNSHTSSFAKHLNGKAHSCGTIHNTMQVLQYYKNGAHMNTIERFHIHAEFTANNHLNDDHTIFPDAIFDTLLMTHQP